MDALVKESLNRNRIKAVGIGKAGNNTISRLIEIGIFGADTISVDIYPHDLFNRTSDDKILIGKITGVERPEITESYAKESSELIKEKFLFAHMVLITCGLGGVTGTGSAPVFAKLAKTVGALSIAVVTMPFTNESPIKQEIARNGLEKLKENADIVILINLDKIKECKTNLSSNETYLLTENILASVIKDITESITLPGLINTNFDDVGNIIKISEIGMIGIGKSQSDNKALKSAKKALKSPILELNVSQAKGALILITGCINTSLEEVKSIVQFIEDELDPNAKITWDVKINEKIKDNITTTIIIV